MSGTDDSDDSEGAIPSDVEAEVVDMSTSKSLAEHRALCLGEGEIA